MYMLDFEEAEEPETRLPIFTGSWIKQEDSRKISTFASVQHERPCVDCNKLWEILQGMGIPDYLTCILRNLYVVQEAAVRIKHRTTDWFKIGKGVQQG